MINTEQRFKVGDWVNHFGKKGYVVKVIPMMNGALPYKYGICYPTGEIYYGVSLSEEKIKEALEAERIEEVQDYNLQPWTGEEAAEEKQKQGLGDLAGTHLPDGYSASLNGKTYEGRCTDVNKNTEFDGLDRKSAMGLMMLCSIGHKFEETDAEAEYYTQMGRDSSWQYQRREIEIKGDRVLIIDPYGNEDKAVGQFTFANDILMNTIAQDDSIITITYKKTKEGN